jgi:hypothetical protein
MQPHDCYELPSRFSLELLRFGSHKIEKEAVQSTHNLQPTYFRQQNEIPGEAAEDSNLLVHGDFFEEFSLSHSIIISLFFTDSDSKLKKL